MCYPLVILFQIINLGFFIQPINLIVNCRIACNWPVCQLAVFSHILMCTDSGFLLRFFDLFHAVPFWACSWLSSQLAFGDLFLCRVNWAFFGSSPQVGLFILNIPSCTSPCSARTCHALPEVFPWWPLGSCFSLVRFYHQVGILIRHAAFVYAFFVWILSWIVMNFTWITSWYYRFQLS